MVEMKGCPSAATLSAWIVEELPHEEVRDLQYHTARCESCAKEVEALRSDTDDYEARMDEHEARLLQAIAQQSAGMRWRPWLLPSVAALAATMAAVGLGVAFHGEGAAPQADLTFKGSLAVQIVAKQGDTQLRVDSNTRLRAGDALRLMVTVATPGHLAVFSIDGKNALSCWYPQRCDGQPLALARGGQHTLPGSVVLDNAPGPERVFIVFHDAPFDLQRVGQQAKALLQEAPRRRLKSSDLHLSALWVMSLQKAESP